jgi:hypothetical protein
MRDLLRADDVPMVLQVVVEPARADVEVLQIAEWGCGPFVRHGRLISPDSWVG